MRRAPRPRQAARIRPAGRGAAFVLDASILAALLGASSAPTPLYPRYQSAWGLTALAVTVVFSAYALALLLALLVTGSLSDHLGRRPVLVGALLLEAAAMVLLEAAAMVLLAAAHGAGALIVARVLQGAATGAATSAAGAALLDLDDPRRPGRSALANSIAPVAGMAAGVLVATLLIALAPAPTVTVYLVLAVLFAAQAAAASRTPETARPHPGALGSLRPRLAAPPSARRALLAVGTAVVAVWALGGFYSCLGPALVRLVAPDAPPSARGMVFFTLATAATGTVWLLRRAAAHAMAVTAAGALAVVPAGLLTLGGGFAAVYGGAALAGVAFGAVSQGALGMTLARLDERDRAATLAAYYVLSYLSMSVPAIAAGVAAQRWGLRAAAHAYAVAAVLLALAALAALAVSAARTARRPRPGPYPDGTARSPGGPPHTPMTTDETRKAKRS